MAFEGGRGTRGCAERAEPQDARANGNVYTTTLPGDYQINWTGPQVLKHDGSQHHGVGILPTVPASRIRAGIAEGRDEVLERALALLDSASTRKK